MTTKQVADFLNATVRDVNHAAKMIGIVPSRGDGPGRQAYWKDFQVDAIKSYLDGA